MASETELSCPPDILTMVDLEGFFAAGPPDVRMAIAAVVSRAYAVGQMHGRLNGPPPYPRRSPARRAFAVSVLPDWLAA